MKLTTGILVVMFAAASWAQNPDIIENTRNTMKAVEQKKEIDQNRAYAASQAQTPKSSEAAPAKASLAPASGKTHVSLAPAAAPKSSASKSSAPKSASKPAPKVQITAAPSPLDKKKPGKKSAAKSKAPAKPAASAPVQTASAQDDKKSDAVSDKLINIAGRRDPFVSPVVNRSMVGSGCSTGKKCLAIDQIALKGVVRSDNGMIAVVVNAVNKAYFLRENDPVFNGYVVKITGDSIVFKETIQDKLGKPLEREITKKITTSAV